ncbi:MAG: tetratricopeptide repeat protein [Spirochaetales bacterium]|nr:tetratricopeptide repeat protein [Spirochaetales bacterium]
MTRRYFTFFAGLLFLALISAPVAADGFEDVSFQLIPGFELPVGQRSAVFNEAAPYTVGGSAAFRGQYIFPGLPLLYLDGTVSYNLQPTQANLLSLLGAGVGTGLNLRVGNNMSFNAGAEAGMYLGMYPGLATAGNPYFGGRVAFSWDFSPSFTLAIGSGYKYYLGYDASSGAYTDLYQGVNATIGTIFKVNSGAERTKMKIENIEMDPVFPVFYSYYDLNALGKVTVRNEENSPVTDVKVYFNVPQYMDQPKLSATIPLLRRGEQEEVNLNALFLNNILQLTEPAKASAEIIVEYTYLGKRFTRKNPYTIRIHHRNAMTWDDDRKAASFVTPRDPTVLLFSKNVISILRDHDTSPINQNFRTAVGIFEALRLYGMNYAIDPDSSYIELSENAAAVDFLQFPSQSLTYRAGDCDDLSILYSALLESVNIETAFVTIPGHIFMAFSLGLSEDEAKKEFTDVEDFLFIEGGAWIPVEITLVTDGFIEAWETGARQWRNASSNELAGFYPVRGAWELYEQVSISGSALPLLFPETTAIIAGYESSMDIFVDREVTARADFYFGKLREDGENAKVRNHLGILYARYGMYDDAEKQFLVAADRDRNYTAPMVNLGNIYFLRGRYDDALSWYQRAGAKDPKNEIVVAGLARAHYELEQFDQARDEYRRLAEIAPETAEKYAYLGQTSENYARASAALNKGKTLWDAQEDIE